MRSTSAASPTNDKPSISTPIWRARLLSAKALLNENPTPTIHEIRDALSGNLCRCTGYTKILEAVLLAASAGADVDAAYQAMRDGAVATSPFPAAPHGGGLITPKDGGL